MLSVTSDDKSAAKRAPASHRTLSSDAVSRSRSTEETAYSPRRHVRCNSVDDGESETRAVASQLHAVDFLKPEPLPTLPRCPMTEGKHCNCWSEPPHATFKIRGKMYLGEKRPKKIASGPFLLQAIGADVLLKNARSGPSTAIAANYSTILGGRLRRTPTFLINFVCPWGVILNYYRIPELYMPYLRAKAERRASLRAAADALAPHERALARFFLGDDRERDATLKLIPVAVEGPLLVKKMVQGKPAIIGQRLPTQYHYHPQDAARGLADCFEVDLDVNATDSIGKTACNMSRKYMNSVTVDLGFVIEGTSEDLLPEQMLGCVRLHRIDGLKAPTLPAL